MAGGPCPDPRSRRARASAARGPRPALQRAGSRLSRTAGAASAASARSARSSPAGRRERRPPVLLCDHPRAASYPCRSNGLHHLAAGGFGSAGSAPDAASGSVPSGGSARAPASETTSAPPLGTLGCSSAPASARGETSPRIPSAGTAADADIVLAVDAGLNDPGAGRRELGSPGSSSLKFLRLSPRFLASSCGTWCLRRVAVLATREWSRRVRELGAASRWGR
jgi:hypothetical protein